MAKRISMLLAAFFNRILLVAIPVAAITTKAIPLNGWLSVFSRLSALMTKIPDTCGAKHSQITSRGGKGTGDEREEEGVEERA